MTCKAGSELLRKLAFLTVAAITLMLCTAIPARAQAIHAELDGATIFAGSNTYTCDLKLVGTPSGVGNWQCTATLTDGTPVQNAERSQGLAEATVETPFGPGEILFPVEVVERPDGTALVTAHFAPPHN